VETPPSQSASRVHKVSSCFASNSCFDTAHRLDTCRQARHIASATAAVRGCGYSGRTLHAGGSDGSAANPIMVRQTSLATGAGRSDPQLVGDDARVDIAVLGVETRERNGLTQLLGPDVGQDVGNRSADAYRRLDRQQAGAWTIPPAPREPSRRRSRTPSPPPAGSGNRQALGSAATGCRSQPRQNCPAERGCGPGNVPTL